jgi:hypothetical protein
MSIKELYNRGQKYWNSCSVYQRLAFATLRQLPVTLAVAKLGWPYNIALPIGCVFGKTAFLRFYGAYPYSLFKYCFKMLSRTIFGFSLKRFVEQTARQAVFAEWGISDDIVQLLAAFMILLCVFLDTVD